jgi:hypothetical protein
VLVLSRWVLSRQAAQITYEFNMIQHRDGVARGTAQNLKIFKGWK